MLNQTIGDYFFDKMLTGEVHFAYRTKSGALRIAHGTMCADIIPVDLDDSEDFTNTNNPEYTDYWDLDADDWRAFDMDEVVWCFGFFSPDLLHSEWESIQEYIDSMLD